MVSSAIQVARSAAYRMAPAASSRVTRLSSQPRHRIDVSLGGICRHIHVGKLGVDQLEPSDRLETMSEPALGSDMAIEPTWAPEKAGGRQFIVFHR